MKKIAYFAIACSVLTACNDFLTEDLKGEYSSETYFISQEAAEAAVAGVYNGLYDNTQWIFGDVASDDAIKGGNAGDQAEINYIDDFTAAADNGVIATYWQKQYEIIARANKAIAGIEGSKVSKEVADQLVAECKVLRSYSYFNLVNIFGEVPLKVRPQDNISAVMVGLSSVDEIYSQIITDLKDAAAVLPASYTADKRGHITSGFANGLLAKACLFQGKYDDCLSAIAKLEADHTYELEANYADLFVEGAEESAEVVFAIRYLRNDVVSRGNNLNVWFAPASDGGYYFNAPTQDYVDCFNELTAASETDPRLDASIGRGGQPWFDGRTFNSAWSESTGYLVKKYNQDKSEDFARAECTIPQHILRYADVLLMKAEALNESGKTTEAYAELDKVRNRAGLANVAQNGTSDLRNRIRVERRRELGFEFHRFFDVMRYGKEYATAALGAAAWPSSRYYYPLPQTETDSNTAINK